PAGAQAGETPDGAADQQRGQREERGVQNGVPRGEERVVNSPVGVRPSIEKHSADEGAGKNCCGPVERTIAPGVDVLGDADGYSDVGVVGGDETHDRCRSFRCAPLGRAPRARALTTSMRVLLLAVGSSMSSTSGSRWRCMANQATVAATKGAAAAGLGIGRSNPTPIRAVRYRSRR